VTTAARSLAPSPSSVVAGRAASASITRSSLLLSAASAVVGVLSYACGLAMTYLLPVSEYGDFAASQTLLLIVGTVASSLVPLPLAHRVRATAPGSPERRRALWRPRP
jgi:biotin transporter BioY